MNYRPIGHMQKNSSVPLVRQFNQAKTVQTTAQFSHFSTDLTRNWFPFGRQNIRVPRHARGRQTSSKIVDAHTAPARSEGCEVRSDTPRSCRCPSLVYRPDCRSGCRCRPHQHDQHRRRRRPSCRRQHHSLLLWAPTLWLTARRNCRLV